MARKNWSDLLSVLFLVQEDPLGMGHPHIRKHDLEHPPPPSPSGVRSPPPLRVTTKPIHHNCNGRALVGIKKKGVFGKGVGNSQNASETRQKCVRNASKMRQNGSCFIGKRGTSKMRQKSVTKNQSIDQIGKLCPKKSPENVQKLRCQSLWTTFGHFSTFGGHFSGRPRTTLGFSPPLDAREPLTRGIPQSRNS